MTLTHGSLFAGIGGFDLGFERAGMKTIWQVEIDEYCRRVLARHFPDAERFNDVRECCGSPLRISSIDGRCAECGRRDFLRYVDVISGGFPCQDISVAGDGAGLDGERSGLWFEYLRIVSEIRPLIVTVENVSALLDRGIERVLGGLAALGYDAEWDCLPASAFGAPHQRDRVFVVAHSREKRIQRVIQGAIPEFPAFSWCKDVRRVEDLRNRPDIPPSLFRGSRDGIPNWVDRVGGCGNAIVPQIAEWIGKRIIEASEITHG